MFRLGDPELNLHLYSFVTVGRVNIPVYVYIYTYNHMICAICISQKLRGKLQMADTISFSFWTDDCMQ